MQKAISSMERVTLKNAHQILFEAYNNLGCEFSALQFLFHFNLFLISFQVVWIECVFLFVLFFCLFLSLCIIFFVSQSVHYQIVVDVSHNMYKKLINFIFSWLLLPWEPHSLPELAMMKVRKSGSRSSFRDILEILIIEDSSETSVIVSSLYF